MPKPPQSTTPHHLSHSLCFANVRVFLHLLLPDWPILHSSKERFLTIWSPPSFLLCSKSQGWRRVNRQTTDPFPTWTQSASCWKDWSWFVFKHTGPGLPSTTHQWLIIQRIPVSLPGRPLDRNCTPANHQRRAPIGWRQDNNNNNNLVWRHCHRVALYKMWYILKSACPVVSTLKYAEYAFISSVANVAAHHSVQQHQYADDTTLYVSM